MNQPLHKMAQTLPSIAAPGTSSPFAIIWIFASIVLSLLILANFGFGLLSSVRAYVGGESLWSKNQKDAIYHLQKYAVSRAPQELRLFRADIAVPLGDRDARIEMDKPNPDLERIRQGFVRAGIHLDDDHYIVHLDDAGTLLEREIESPHRTPRRSNLF